MALQVWLPMTKDLRQQGLSGTTVTNTGATYSSAGGKLGGCYIFDGSDDAIAIGNLSTLVSSEYSFACWFYHDDTWSSKSYETIFGGPSGFELEAKNSSTNSPVLRLYNWGGSTCAYELNTWNHIVFTRNTTETKLYLNGELKLTGTAGSIPSGDYFIGSWKTSTGQNYKGKMCDVRIYDHCLSPMEVKQLSQGLVLHYPLNRGGFGQENLLSGNNAKITTWTNYMPDSVILSGDGYDNKYTLIEGIGGWEKIFTDPISVISGQDYTLSFDYSVEQNYRGYSGQFGLAVCTSSQAQYGNDTNVITKVNFGLVQKEKSRTSVTFTATSDIIYLVANGGCIEDGQTNVSFYISYLKLEKGSIATPWCPNSSDAFATTMGLNGTTEYDCSGYCNNGQYYSYDSYGSITYSSDTPKYSVSLHLDNDGKNASVNTKAGTKYIYGSCPLTTPKELTVAFWCKPIAGYYGGTGQGQFCTVGHPYGDPNVAGDYSSTCFHHRDGYIDFCASDNTHDTITINFTGSEWHHYVISYNGQTIKIYKDGQETNSKSFDSTKTLKSMLGVVIGYSYAGGAHRSNNSYYSDFRIYTTALSASDVLFLYQNSHIQ